jgi:hypothetical protein
MGRRPLVLALLVASSCEGTIGSTGAIQPGPSPMRRLTRFEYNNTVRDLLGDTTQPANAFPPEELAFGFDNNADALATSPLLAEQYLLAAENLAKTAVQNLGKLVPCDPAGGESCAHTFIVEFGRRAWRRPLEPDEVDGLLALFRSGADFPTGIRLVLEVMLQSPAFLYRVETGAPGAAARPSSWEMASRLSYLFWATMPDDTLFRAAAADELAASDQVLAQAQRMLADPRARVVVDNFHRQWLQLNRTDSMQKDAAIYPAFSAELAQLMKTETHTFLDYVVFDGNGDLDMLLEAPFSFMNATLAQFYGVAGPSGSTFERVALNPTERAGLLSQAGLLAIYAKPNQTDPVHRGKLVREKFFCQTLPAPPGNIVIMPPPLDPTLTTRQRFQQHSTDPACASCHTLMDPIGLGFESFDGIGQFRTTENGLTIDASGTISASDVDGNFVGVVDLAHRLAQSQEVRACVETPDDRASLEELQQRFEQSGYKLRDLILALAQTDAFLYRAAPRPGGP